MHYEGDQVLQIGPCVMEPIMPRHAPAMWRSFQDSRESLAPYMWWVKTTKSAEDLLDYVRRAQRSRLRGTEFVYVVLDSGRQHLATVGLHQVNMRGKSAELGYWVWDNMAGRGIATAASARLLRLAFTTLKLHRVYVRHAIDNLASRSVIMKLGFTHEGTMRDDEYVNDKWVTHEIFGLLQPEFQQKQQQLRELEKKMQLEGQN